MRTLMTVDGKSKHRSVDSFSRRHIDEQAEDSPPGAHLKGMCPGIRTGSTFGDILFQQAFQHVAEENNLVIGIREPNPLGVDLLAEGYASKSLHIKAKSSIYGPTAGFVAAAPVFGKLGTAGEAKQSKYIDDAIKAGAGKVPLQLSDKRVLQLTNQNLIKWVARDKVSARYGDATHHFTMKRQQYLTELPWAVLHDTGEPVEILSNPTHIKGPSGPKSAVTADYDLFGLYPRRNRGNNVRPVEPVARVLGRNKAGIEARANIYLNRIREETKHNQKTERDQEAGRTSRRDDKADLGNFHQYGKTIKNALNRRIAQHGYRGGLLVHHGDENSNPDSAGQDFPLRFVVPHMRTMVVKDNAQLLGAYRWFRQLGFSVDINPAFSFRSWKSPRTRKLRDSAALKIATCWPLPKTALSPRGPIKTDKMVVRLNDNQRGQLPQAFDGRAKSN